MSSARFAHGLDSLPARQNVLVGYETSTRSGHPRISTSALTFPRIDPNNNEERVRALDHLFLDTDVAASRGMNAPNLRSTGSNAPSFQGGAALGTSVEIMSPYSIAAANVMYGKGQRSDDSTSKNFAVKLLLRDEQPATPATHPYTRKGQEERQFASTVTFQLPAEASVGKSLQDNGGLPPSRLISSWHNFILSTLHPHESASGTNLLPSDATFDIENCISTIDLISKIELEARRRLGLPYLVIKHLRYQPDLEQRHVDEDSVESSVDRQLVNSDSEEGDNGSDDDDDVEKQQPTRRLQSHRGSPTESRSHSRAPTRQPSPILTRSQSRRSGNENSSQRRDELDAFGLPPPPQVPASIAKLLESARLANVGQDTKHEPVSPIPKPQQFVQLPPEIIRPHAIRASPSAASPTVPEWLSLDREGAVGLLTEVFAGARGTENSGPNAVKQTYTEVVTNALRSQFESVPNAIVAKIEAQPRTITFTVSCVMSDRDVKILKQKKSIPSTTPDSTEDDGERNTFLYSASDEIEEIAPTLRLHASANFDRPSYRDEPFGLVSGLPEGLFERKGTVFASNVNDILVAVSKVLGVSSVKPHQLLFRNDTDNIEVGGGSTDSSVLTGQVPFLQSPSRLNRNQSILQQMGNGTFMRGPNSLGKSIVSSMVTTNQGKSATAKEKPSARQFRDSEATQMAFPTLLLYRQLEHIGQLGNRAYFLCDITDKGVVIDENRTANDEITEQAEQEETLSGKGQENILSSKMGAFFGQRGVLGNANSGGEKENQDPEAPTQKYKSDLTASVDGLVDDRGKLNTKGTLPLDHVGLGYFPTESAVYKQRFDRINNPYEAERFDNERWESAGEDTFGRKNSEKAHSTLMSHRRAEEIDMDDTVSLQSATPISKSERNLLPSVDPYLAVTGSFVPAFDRQVRYEAGERKPSFDKLSLPFSMRRNAPQEHERGEVEFENERGLEAHFDNGADDDESSDLALRPSERRWLNYLNDRQVGTQQNFKHRVASVYSADSVVPRGLTSPAPPELPLYKPAQPTTYSDPHEGRMTDVTERSAAFNTESSSNGEKNRRALVQFTLNYFITMHPFAVKAFTETELSQLTRDTVLKFQKTREDQTAYPIRFPLNHTNAAELRLIADDVCNAAKKIKDEAEKQQSDAELQAAHITAGGNGFSVKYNAKDPYHLSSTPSTRANLDPQIRAALEVRERGELEDAHRLSGTGGIITPFERAQPVITEDSPRFAKRVVMADPQWDPISRRLAMYATTSVDIFGGSSEAIAKAARDYFISGLGPIATQTQKGNKGPPPFRWFLRTGQNKPSTKDSVALSEDIGLDALLDLGIATIHVITRVTPITFSLELDLDPERDFKVLEDAYEKRLAHVHSTVGMFGIDEGTQTITSSNPEDRVRESSPLRTQRPVGGQHINRALDSATEKERRRYNADMYNVLFSRYMALLRSVVPSAHMSLYEGPNSAHIASAMASSRNVDRQIANTFHSAQGAFALLQDAAATSTGSPRQLVRDVENSNIDEAEGRRGAPAGSLSHLGKHAFVPRFGGGRRSRVEGQTGSSPASADIALPNRVVPNLTAIASVLKEGLPYSVGVDVYDADQDELVRCVKSFSIPLGSGLVLSFDEYLRRAARHVGYKY